MTPFILLIGLYYFALLNALPADDAPLPTTPQISESTAGAKPDDNNRQLLDNAFPTATPSTTAAPATPANTTTTATTTTTTTLNTSVKPNETIPFVARYAVRWQSPQKGQFGATFNFTFNDADLFNQEWMLRFRFHDLNATLIENYWGSWKTVSLTKGWYLLLPNKSPGELGLNEQQTVYFSFNGKWNASTDWNTDKMAVDVFELQTRSSSDVSPLVKDLTNKREFDNAEIPFTLPSEPFGHFIRTTSLEPQKMFGASPNVVVKHPTENRFGVYVCLPILAIFAAVLLTGTVNRWLSRSHFRLQLKERDLQKAAGGGGGGVPITDKKSARTTAIFTGSNRLSMFPAKDSVIGEGGALGEVLESYTQKSFLLNPGAEYRKSIHPSFEARFSRPSPPRAPPQSEATSHHGSTPGSTANTVSIKVMQQVSE